MPEKIPCPVAGCGEVFDDEAAAIAHMKAEHRDEFTAHTGVSLEETVLKVEDVPIGRDNEDADALAMVPPGLMKAIEGRMDARIQLAIEAERPQIAAAVKGAIEQVVAKARQAGIPIPGVTLNPAGEGGVIPGSPVTPQGAELLKMIFGAGGGQGTQMEELAKTLTQARAISDVLNPPSIWDRVMQNAVLRSLSKAGLVTEAEVKELTTPAATP